MIEDEDFAEIGTLSDEPIVNEPLAHFMQLMQGGNQRVERSSRITLPPFPGHANGTPGVTINVRSWSDFTQNGGLEITTEGQPATAEEWNRIAMLISDIVGNR